MNVVKQILLIACVSILFTACSSMNDYKPLYEVKPVKEDAKR